MANHIVAFDVESLDLYSDPFAVSMVVFDQKSGKEVETHTFYYNPAGQESDWVRENVMPLFEEQPETCQNLMGLLHQVRDIMVKYKGAQFVCDVAYPVETRLFARIQEFGLLGPFDFPFPLLDLASIRAGVLLAQGSRSVSLEEIRSPLPDYLDRSKLPADVAKLDEHHCLYDAWLALIEYRAMMDV